METNTTKNTPPTHVEGCEVYVCGDPLEFRGEEWVTLSPEDETDERLWEFSLTTGRIKTDG
jgi:hypothetical protein